MIVLDTNVVSEMMRPSPHAGVDRWLAALPRASAFITTITEAELRYGIALLPGGRRRDALERALEAMIETEFSDRVLPFDSNAAIAFAAIAAGRRQKGKPISTADAQIAAIAGSRGSVLATRNEADFESCGVEVINPWKSAR